MTTEQIALSEARLRDLLALALKATPGQWEYRHDDEVWTQSDRFLASAVIDDDAAFIAAANADTIRSLVTEMLALREAVKPFAALGQYILDEDLQTKPDDRPIWGFDRHELTYGDFRAAAKAARALSHPEPMK